MNSVALVAQFGGTDLFTDGTLLIDAFAAQGVTAEIAAWGEPRNWGVFDQVIVRATYDYIDRPAEFFAWAHDIEQRTRLANPAALLEWNGDKRYLRDLAAAGVPTVPTHWVEPGEPSESVLGEAGLNEFVVKPATSAGSRLAARYEPGERPRAIQHLQRLAELGLVAMVQPYLGRVDAEGETGTFVFAGEVSHAITKSAALHAGQPAAEDFAVGFAQIVSGTPVTEELTRFAARVLAAIPERLPSPLYARVDTLRDDAGELAVVELELIEPFLFLDTHPAAAGNFVRAACSWC